MRTLDSDLDSVIFPQHHVQDDDGTTQIPDFVVCTVSGNTFRTVLIVELKKSLLWKDGIPALQRQIKLQTDASFEPGEISQANGTVFFISVIGPHWRYGVEHDDGQDPIPLIEWHRVTHNQSSYQDFQVLTGLVASL